MDFVQRSQPGTQEVIIEIDAAPQVELPRIDGTHVRAPQILPADEAELQQMDHFEDSLKGIHVTDFVRINHANAFVASVTSEQLKAITLLPASGIIRPNRTHRVG